MVKITTFLGFNYWKSDPFCTLIGPRGGGVLNAHLYYPKSKLKYVVKFDKYSYYIVTVGLFYFISSKNISRKCLLCKFYFRNIKTYILAEIWVVKEWRGWERMGEDFTLGLNRHSSLWILGGNVLASKKTPIRTGF